MESDREKRMNSVTLRMILRRMNSDNDTGADNDEGSASFYSATLIHHSSSPDSVGRLNIGMGGQPGGAGLAALRADVDLGRRFRSLLATAEDDFARIRKVFFLRFEVRHLIAPRLDE